VQLARRIKETDLSSAEDKTSSTVLPSQASSNSSQEEFTVGPHQGDTAGQGSPSEGASQTEANAGSSPAPSVAEPDEQAAPLKTKPLPKVNAVARAIRVRVTGARVGNVPEERDLFAESTTTVLIFEKGGVIRLTAAVTPRQLLFLTNEESKREVVAQVIRKRTYRPTECYVELEFTESVPEFWGMEFSAATALLPKDAQEVAAAEMIASAETTDDELDGAAPPPSAEEVEALKREVEALRSKLNLLQTQPEPVPPAQADSATVPQAAPSPPGIQTSQAEVLQYQTEKIPWTELSADAFPMEGEAKPGQVPAANQIVLPKPSMVFRKALPGRNPSFRARGQFTPGFRTGMLRIAILSSILGALMGTAWYRGWLPWFQRARKIPVSSWAGGVTIPVSPRRAVSVEPKTAEANLGNNPSVSVRVTTPGSSSEALKSAAGNENAMSSVVVTEPKQKPVVTVRSTPPGPMASPSPVRSLAAKPINSVPTSGSHAHLVPPKLIKSERAIASLDDLKDFETGSVVIDAVIDTEGNVTSPKILSGPPSLRWPALRAVKNYKYEPAMEDGHPVAAHVTVRIQFHFVE
jgi:TonB family protein